MAPEIVCYCEHRLKNILPKSHLILPTIVAKVFWKWKFLESFELQSPYIQEGSVDGMNGMMITGNSI